MKMGKRKYESESSVPLKKRNTGENNDKNLGDDVQDLQPQNLLQSEINEKKTPINYGFDIKHFRKDLSSKQGQTMALTQFLQVCMNPDNEVDYIMQYLKTGGNSHEILRQVNQDNKKNLTLATPAFQIFHLIILKVQSSLPHLITITEEACRYFLNTFMPTVEIMISENSGPRHRKVILKLLTSMVTLNPDLGIEMLSQAPLTPKHLQYIVEKSNYKEKDNVRTAFVHFMTSFLVDGHLPLIKALLEKQGLLALVIPGLVYDDAEAVLMFLNILKNNIIDNAVITKSLKLKTFSHQVLHNIFKIYSWKGPSELSNETKNQLRQEIIKLLTDIVLTLFTSNRLGLYFTDTSLGTSDVNKNQNLYRALLTLKRPWENENQSEVILEIIYKCPDLHRAIMHIIEQSFEPNHSPIWEKTVQFVIKLINKLKPEEMILKMSSLNSLQVANLIRFITLPIPILKHIQLNIGKDPMISLYCVRVLVTMLETFKRYMQILESDDNRSTISDLKNKIENFFPKHLPTPSVVLGQIQNIINNDIDKDSDSNKQDYKLPSIEKVDSLILLIDLLLLYNDIHSPFLEIIEGSLNMKEILEFSKNISGDRNLMLRFKIVSLWLKLDNSAISLDNPMFKDLFIIILEIYISSSDSWTEAEDTLYLFFKKTTIFEGDEDEIHLMLYTLRNSTIDPISLIADITEYVLSNTLLLNEYIRNQIVHFEISDCNSQESLDRLFKDLMDGRCTEDSSFLESKIPSPFIVGCIQYIQNNKHVKAPLANFLSMYIANLLHTNFSPELTEVLIDDCKLDVRNYVASWIGEPAALPDMALGKDDILNNISKSIIKLEEIELEIVFPALEICAEQYDIIINETRYKIKSMDNINCAQLLICAKYLVFCIVRLTNMNQLKEEQLKKITDYFHCVIEIGKKNHTMSICRRIILSLLKIPQVLRIYRPLPTKNDESTVLATKFILDCMDMYSDIVKYVDNKYKIFKPYQEKNYKQIIKAFVKINKKKNMETDLILRALHIIGLTTSDDLCILKQIVSQDVSACVKDDKEPSFVLEILNVLIENYCKTVKLQLKNAILKDIMKLYTGLLTNTNLTPNLTKLENSLVQYFKNNPHQVKYISDDNFKQFFFANAVRKSTANLAHLLLKLKSNFCSIFKENISRPDILSQRELTLPLGSAVINHNQFLIENKEFLDTIFNEYKQNILKFLIKPHKAGQIYITCWKFIRKLILECMNVKDCESLFSKIHKYETVEIVHINLYHTAFLKYIFVSDTPTMESLMNYFITMINLTLIVLKDKYSTSVCTIITNICVVIEIYESCNWLAAIEKSGFKKITESATWKNFCKVVLKDSLRVKRAEQTTTYGPELLYVLNNLVKVLYPSNHDDLVTLFDMVTSHSEFLNVMLSNHSTDIKSRLLELMYTLIVKNESVMKSQHVPVYLSAYHATKSPCDRLLLKLLYFYESHSQPVNEYKPYIWGDSAANYYSVRKNRNASLWSHPTPNQVINLLDKDVIEKTIRQFPVTQKLEYNYVLPSNIDTISNLLKDGSIKKLLVQLSRQGYKLPSSIDIEETVNKRLRTIHFNKAIAVTKDTDIVSSTHLEEDESIYDPSFIFPLLSYLLAPGSVASCFKLLRNGLLSLPIMALSSYCPAMRAAAYHVLHRFCMLLETETRHKNDKLLLSDYIDTLRRSLSSAISTADQREHNTRDAFNPRIPAVVALYLAKALIVSTAPFDPLYKPINNFLIAKQYIDLTVVPDFLTLFHDSDMEFADRRIWILDVIKHGTKTMSDINVIFKTMCLKMIMDFYSSTLSDRKSKERILGVMTSVVSIPRAFEILVEGYSLLAWLNAVVRQLGRGESSLVKAIMTLITNARYSMMVNSYSRSMQGAVKNGKTFDVKVSKDIENEILLIVYELLWHLDISNWEEVIAYAKIYKLLSRRAVKQLSKQQMLNLVNLCTFNQKNSESVNILSKAIQYSDVKVMECNIGVPDYGTDTKIDELQNDLKIIIGNYIV